MEWPPIESTVVSLDTMVMGVWRPTLRCKIKAVKLLAERIRKRLFDAGLGNDL